VLCSSPISKKLVKPKSQFAFTVDRWKGNLILHLYREILRSRVSRFGGLWLCSIFSQIYHVYLSSYYLIDLSIHRGLVDLSLYLHLVHLSLSLYLIDLSLYLYLIDLTVYLSICLRRLGFVDSKLIQSISSIYLFLCISSIYLSAC